jgi:hypothetical protein
MSSMKSRCRLSINYWRQGVSYISLIYLLSATLQDIFYIIKFVTSVSTHRVIIYVDLVWRPYESLPLKPGVTEVGQVVGHSRR